MGTKQKNKKLVITKLMSRFRIYVHSGSLTSSGLLDRDHIDDYLIARGFVRYKIAQDRTGKKRG